MPVPCAADFSRAGIPVAGRGRDGRRPIAADLARIRPGGGDEGALRDAAAHLGGALGLDAASIALRSLRRKSSLVYELRHGTRCLGSLVVPGDTPRASAGVFRSAPCPCSRRCSRRRWSVTGCRPRLSRRGRCAAAMLKTALLRSVSHDLRSPLTAILTAGTAIAADEISRADRQALGRAVTDQAERLTALVEELLDLSRLQAGNAEPRREWALVDELLHETARQLDPDGSHFAFTIMPSYRSCARIRSSSSARLPTSWRTPCATRRCCPFRCEHGSPMRICGSASSTAGPGIPREDLARIFGAFYRGPAQPAQGGGSGLGLAIVKGFVEANGGSVWAESLPGQATSFVVALPLEPTVPDARPRSDSSVDDDKCAGPLESRVSFPREYLAGPTPASARNRTHASG